MALRHTLNEIAKDNLSILQTIEGWYDKGEFYIIYKENNTNYITNITEFVDEEMKVLFQTLDLLKDHSWSLAFNIVDCGDYYDIDTDSIH